MAIAVVATAQAQNTGSATLTISKPTGTLEGHLMITGNFQDGHTVAGFTGDTGWTEVYDVINPSFRWAYKIAGASEPSSYSFTGPNTQLSGFIVTLSGAVYDTSGTPNALATPVVANGITVASDNSLLLAVYKVQNLSKTFTTPTGMTTVCNDADAWAPSFAVFKESVNAGATGNRSSTPSGGATGNGLLISVKPSAPAIVNRALFFGGGL